ncbi:hypothetical protein [Clostridium lundense]|uniref:hypothetical protein n=1 Tax=Clostridium lundense TaxID=319475 RepID=UPI0006842268|nr:hypothetical protein [Clostridium lundense]
MNRNEVESIVEKINSYLNSELWMDFEVTQYTNYKLLLTGSIDPSSSNSDIEIEFQEVYYASMLFNWKTDISIQAIELVSDYEAEEMYSKYKIESGTYIFKFYPEDYSSDVECYVCAKNISYIINEKDF